MTNLPNEIRVSGGDHERDRSPLRLSAKGEKLHQTAAKKENQKSYRLRDGVSRVGKLKKRLLELRKMPGWR